MTIQGSGPAFIHSSLDRAAQRRCDTAWIDAARRNPASRCIGFDGDKALVRETGTDGLELADVGGAAAGPECILLGIDPTGRAVFASDGAEALAAEGWIARDLRSLASEGRLAAEDLGLLAEARSLLAWHARHRFCANCGAPSDSADGGWRRVCPTCAASHFPRTDPVVIVGVRHGDRLLLGRQPQFPPGMYSALAGYVEPGETIEQAAAREMFEEAGVRLTALRYHSSQPWPFPSSLMIGLLADAEDERLAIDREELEDARWFSRQECEAMLAGAHRDGLKAPQPVAIAHHLIRALL